MWALPASVPGRTDPFPVSRPSRRHRAGWRLAAALLALTAFADGATAKVVGRPPCTLSVPDDWSVSRDGEGRNATATVRVNVRPMDNGTLAVQTQRLAGMSVLGTNAQLTILKQENGQQVRFIAIAPARPERACQAEIVGTTREGIREAASQARRVSPPRR